MTSEITITLPKRRNQSPSNSPLSPKTKRIRSLFLRLFSPTSSKFPKQDFKPDSRETTVENPKNFLYYSSKSANNSPLSSPIVPKEKPKRIRKAKSAFALFSMSKPTLVGQSVRSFTDNEATDATPPKTEVKEPHHVDPSLDELVEEGVLLNNDDHEATSVLFDKEGKLKETKESLVRLTEAEKEIKEEKEVKKESEEKDIEDKEEEKEEDEEEEEIKEEKEEREEEEKEEDKEGKEVQIKEKEEKKEEIEDDKEEVEDKEEAKVEEKDEVEPNHSITNSESNKPEEEEKAKAAPSVEDVVNMALTDLDSVQESPLEASSLSPETSTTLPSSTTPILSQVGSYTSSHLNQHFDDPAPPEHILERDSEFVPPAAAREGAHLTSTNSFKTGPHTRDSMGTTASSVNLVRPNLAGGDSYQQTVSSESVGSETTEVNKTYLKALSKTLSYQSVKSGESETEELEKGGALLSDSYDQNTQMEETVDKVLEKVESLRVEEGGTIESIIDEVNHEVEEEKMSELNRPSTPPPPMKIPEIKTDLKYDGIGEVPKSPLEKVADEILSSPQFKSEDAEEDEKVKEEKEVGDEKVEEKEVEAKLEKDKVEEMEVEKDKVEDVNKTSEKETVKEEVKEEAKKEVKEEIKKEVTSAPKKSGKDDIDNLLDGQELDLKEIEELEKMLDSDILTSTKSFQTNASSEHLKPKESVPLEKTPSATLLPKPENPTEESNFNEEIRQQIINDLKDEPVYIFTSLASGAYHMIPRTNRLSTILTVNKVPFTFRDLGTDSKARKAWKRYGNGRTLPAVVRGKDDIIGNWEEMDNYAENWEVRKKIYEEY